VSGIFEIVDGASLRRYRRTRAKLSGVDFAERIGYPDSHLSNVERGSSVFSPTFARSIELAFPDAKVKVPPMKYAAPEPDPTSDVAPEVEPTYDRRIEGGAVAVFTFVLGVLAGLAISGVVL